MKGCLNCSLGNKGGGCQVGSIYNQKVSEEQLVEIVEKWAAEHPAKTRQSEFLKMFPDSGKDKDGVIIVPPCAVEKSRFGGIGIRCNVSEKDCVKCKHDYWLEEVEE